MRREKPVIRIKRTYDAPSRNDDYGVLEDRRWPKDQQHNNAIALKEHLEKKMEVNDEKSIDR